MLVAFTYAVPAQTQPLSDKLLQGMSRDLHKLSPATEHGNGNLRPENKILNNAPRGQDRNKQAAQNAPFDYYVLSLSWSPSYCADNGRKPNARQQCGTGRNHSFIVHGLWPQYERGFPQSCAHNQANAQVPRDMASGLSDIMPSAGLMRHQWRKHGTCTGLSQRDYFNTIRDAYQAVTVPPALRNVTSPRMVDPVLIEKAFIAANPGLSAKAIAVTCKRRRLQEVRICMDKGLNFRPCREVDRKSCRSRNITLLPNR